MKNPNLWRVAVFQNQFQAAVVIKIGESERAAVIREVQSKRTRHFGERAVPIIRKGYISFIPTPRLIRPDQFIESIPSMLVTQGWRGVVRRFCNHLPPEKAAKIVAVLLPLRRGDVSVGNVNVRIPVVIEVPQIG